MTNSTPSPYKSHRFPVEIISHCIWLYYTFPLSYRDTLENDEDGAVRRFPPLRQLSGA